MRDTGAGGNIQSRVRASIRKGHPPTQRFVLNIEAGMTSQAPPKPASPHKIALLLGLIGSVLYGTVPYFSVSLYKSGLNAESILFLRYWSGLSVSADRFPERQERAAAVARQRLSDRVHGRGSRDRLHPALFRGALPHPVQHRDPAVLHLSCADPRARAACVQDPGAAGDGGRRRS
jgi:hypothetical protein